MRQIEIDKGCADLKTSQELQKEKIELQKAKQIQARIEEAEALANMRLEEAVLEAEEKMLAAVSLIRLSL